MQLHAKNVRQVHIVRQMQMVIIHPKNLVLQAHTMQAPAKHLPRHAYNVMRANIIIQGGNQSVKIVLPVNILQQQDLQVAMIVHVELLQILDVVFCFIHAPFQFESALDQVIMLVDLFLKLRQAVLCQLLCRQHTEQRTEQCASEAEDGYENCFTHLITSITWL
jgi:hypothetical protein